MTNLIASRAAAIGLLAALMVSPVPRAGAQGTALVPTSDFVYADIDRLSELGVLDSVIIGQRPCSRREIARIARVALRYGL